MLDKVATSKPLNVIAALGFTILAIGLWTGNGSWFWRIVITFMAIFQLSETYRLYKR